MRQRIDILRIMLGLVLVGIGFMALIAIPCEEIALSRWFALLLVSKAVGFGAMGIGVWLLQKHISDENI